MQRKTLLISAALICGIAAIILLSRHSNAPQVSGDTTAQSSSATSQSAETKSATSTHEQAIADAASSIARPAPADPSDIQKVLNRKLAQSGEKMEIKIQREDGGELVPILNEAGETERVQMEMNETVTVSLHYPEAEVGEKVLVAPYDGGKVNGKERTAIHIPLDEYKRLSFKFTAGKDPGRYQVSLDKGGDSKNFRSWAGPRANLAGQ